MMIITDFSLTITRHGRRVELEELELNFQIRALVQLGIDPATARIFVFNNGERGPIIALAVRKRLLADSR